MTQTFIYHPHQELMQTTLFTRAWSFGDICLALNNDIPLNILNNIIFFIAVITRPKNQHGSL